MNGYIATYHSVSIEIRAGSLYKAKLEAIRQFAPRKGKESLISVTLAERADGSAVVHVPDF